MDIWLDAERERVYSCENEIETKNAIQNSKYFAIGALSLMKTNLFRFSGKIIPRVHVLWWLVLY